jgi:hypothetical protein
MEATLLEQVKADIEKRFDDTLQQRNQLNEELLRIQGEYRSVNRLLEQANQTEPVEGEILNATDTSA